MVYTKEQIYQSIRCEDIPIDADNAVACQMKQLRKKLRNNPKGAPYIETVWGVGYKFNHGMQESGTAFWWYRFRIWKIKIVINLLLREYLIIMLLK